jgi:hypothetical protein
LHGDPLLAHLERGFDSFKIPYSISFPRCAMGAAHVIDLPSVDFPLQL